MILLNILLGWVLMKKLAKIMANTRIMTAILAVSVLLCIGTAIGAMLWVISSGYSTPSAEIVNKLDDPREVFKRYSEANEGIITVIMISNLALIILLFFLLLISLVHLSLWRQDKKKLALFREKGITYERIEFLSGGRLKIDSIEIELNKAQLKTMLELVKKRAENLPLHPADIKGDNGAQTIKRLREELGCKIIERTLIKNFKGQGYWLDTLPENIKIYECDQENINS